MQNEDIKIQQQVIVRTPKKLDLMGTVTEHYADREVVGVLVNDPMAGWDVVLRHPSELTPAPEFDWSQVW